MAVLSGAIHNIGLYEAPLWQQAILKQKCSIMLETTLKSVLLRVASFYITVSLVVLQDNTGISPIDLMARESVFTYLHIHQNQTITRIFAKQNRLKGMGN